MHRILKATAFAIGPALAALLAPLDAQASGYQVSATSSAAAGNVYDNGSATCGYSASGGVCNGGGSWSGAVNPLGADGSARTVTASTAAEGAGASATSRVTADLATASLHLYGADSGQTAYVSSQGPPYGYTSEYGSLHDTLHFAVLGASADTVTTITAVFTLEGSLLPGFDDIDTPNTSAAEIHGGLLFAGVPSRFDLQNNASTNFMTVAGLDNYPSGLAESTWTTNADHTVNISTFTFNVIGAAQDFSFDLFADLGCSTGYTCDFGDTAAFALSLPSNVSFTSDSGVFLTAATAPGGVPEPATWAMMLVGFGGLGASLRRRRSRAALAHA